MLMRADLRKTKGPGSVLPGPFRTPRPTDGLLGSVHGIFVTVQLIPTPPPFAHDNSVVPL